VEGQGSRVAEDPLWLALSVPRPELPHHEIRPGWRRKLRQPVHAACLTDPVARPYLIRVDAVLVTGLSRLTGCKKPALVVCRLVESAESGCIARHAIKPKMI
jgi:hypothetical protein